MAAALTGGAALPLVQSSRRPARTTTATPSPRPPAWRCRARPPASSDSGTDADWFRFEVAASGELTAETTGGLDTVGELYDADGNRAFNDDSDGSLNFRIQRQLDAGTYYVKVEPFGNGTGSYTLRLGFEARADGRPAPSATPWDPHRRNLGDFDGDAKDDVLLRHEDGRWHYHRMNGRRPLAGSGGVGLTTDLAWHVAGSATSTATGADVLLRHEDGRWRYYPMDGRAVRSGSGAVNLADDTTVIIAGIGDMDGDSRADVLTRRIDGSWYYYAMDGRRVLSATGEAALTGNLAWGALPGGAATGGPTTGTPLPDQSMTLRRDEAIDLPAAFVDDQMLMYEIQSSDPDVVRATC